MENLTLTRDELTELVRDCAYHTIKESLPGEPGVVAARMISEKFYQLAKALDWAKRNPGRSNENLGVAHRVYDPDCVEGIV